ncbi:MAG: ATP-grasp domain-containing protein [Polyangiaceae bacterium]|nr:ATP-grasp domain-containing protein [Polyangiaceae bacterium]
MRIALTYNVKISGSPDEAEFDSPTTIDAIEDALVRAGHDVERVEVAGPASRVISRLESISPDLVFNTAEGLKGKTREAFYPALFDELGFPYTGSDAYTLCTTLDKMLTKRTLAGYGVPTPRARLVTRRALEAGALDDVTFPVIVKPNFEGSSKGISSDFSVCQNTHELAEVVERQLVRFPAGLIIEQFLRGIDISCSFVAGLGRDGILDPIEYVIAPASSKEYNVYDFYLKHVRPEHVTLRIAELPGPVLDRIQDLSQRVVKALDIQDLGRCGFRVAKSSSASGYDVHFLEVDALPSLDPNGGMFIATRKSGTDFDGVIRSIVRSACKRRGLQHLLDGQATRRAKKAALRVGLTFNMKRDGGDAEAEFDSPTTIAAITSAIESFGHTVIPLEAKPDLPHRLMAAGPDVVFNIAEGIRGRGREAQVPALLELLGVPYSGSDPTTMSLCLDKGLTKQILRAAGIDTPEWQVLVTGREKLKPLRYPVIVKPNAEGTSKGITGASVVGDEASARAAAKLMVERYGQPALVEEYVAGREFTVGLLGERRPKVLPPMEVIFVEPGQTPVYGYEEKQMGTTRVRFECPAVVTTAEQKRIEKIARDAFAALHCRDVARIDLRMAKDGTVYVIECNPLPGLTPDFSDLCVIGKVASLDFRTLIGEILAGCIKRYRSGRAAAASPFASSVAPLVHAAPPIAQASPTLAAAAPTAHMPAKPAGN